MKDLIDRQAAIDAINNIMPTKEGFLEPSEVLCELMQLPSAQPETSTEIQEILDYLDTTLHPIVSPDNWHVYSELHDMVSMLPSAQPDPCDVCAHKDDCGDMRIYCPAERRTDEPER